MWQQMEAVGRFDDDGKTSQRMKEKSILRKYFVVKIMK